MDSTEDTVPEEVHEKLEAFDKSLTEVENVLKPFLKIPITDMREKHGKGVKDITKIQINDPLENAKMDLMVAYTTNSLFWTYLITQGVDPREHPIKDEMLRIKKYMGKVQQLQDKKTMARVDTNAAKRFVRNALWQPSGKDSNDASSQEDDDSKELSEEAKEKKSSKKKRKKPSDNDAKSSEKKKKKKKKKVKDD